MQLAPPQFLREGVFSLCALTRQSVQIQIQIKIQNTKYKYSFNTGKNLFQCVHSHGVAIYRELGTEIQ